MKLYISALVCLLLFAENSKCADVGEAFTANEIVPNVIGEKPDTLLNLVYEGTEVEVQLGNELAPKDVVGIPKVTYTANEDDFYTLIMTDPDAPSRTNQSMGEFLHWLTVNIPGSKINDGQVVAEYVGSGPPKDTGLHRYIFLLYSQPKKIDFDEPQSKNTEYKNRLHFSSKKFAQKYNLDKLVAGNFYEAQYDDSVPKLHAQLNLGV